MGEHLKNILETIRDKQIDTLLVIGAIATLGASFLLMDLYPRVKGQEPVVKRETALEFSHSYGYDFDKDGKLDYAKQWSNAGRAGVWSLTLPKNSLEFKALQDKYSNK